MPRAIVTLVRDPARRAAMGLAGLETVRRLVPTADERRKAEVDLAVRVAREARARRQGRSSRGGR
jgi:hypothetical protein